MSERVQRIRVVVGCAMLWSAHGQSAAAATPPSASTRPVPVRSTAQEAELRVARQALTIARDECLTRLRQTPEYAELRRKHDVSYRERQRALDSGTAEQQMAAEEAVLKSLMDHRDLMVSAINADPAVAKAKAALQAAEAASRVEGDRTSRPEAN